MKVCHVSTTKTFHNVDQRQADCSQQHPMHSEQTWSWPLLAAFPETGQSVEFRTCTMNAYGLSIYTYLNHLFDHCQERVMLPG